MSTNRHCLHFLIVLAIVLGLRCRDGGNLIEPPFKDPRTLRWSADTIIAEYTFQSTLRTLWGSSSRDVYLTGSTSSGAVLYHFDGASWSEISMPRSSRGSYDIQMVRGTGPKDLWLIGAEWYYNFSPPPSYFDSTLVLHFNGSHWDQYLTQNREGFAQSLFIVDATEVWVSGRKSVWGYQGGLWVRDTIPLQTSAQGFCGINGLAVDKDGTLFVNFLYGPLVTGPVEQHYFFSLKNSVWTLLDSAVVQPGSVELKWGYDNLWYDPSAGLYSLGNGLSKWNGGSWDLVQSGPSSVVQMCSTGDGGLIVVGTKGTVLHFNGTDWYQFPQFKNDNVIYTDVWTDGKEVFITGYEINGVHSIVLHGK